MNRTRQAETAPILWRRSAQTTRFVTRAVALTASLFLAQDCSVIAHDIWLQADQFTLERGDTMVVRQLLGDEFGSDLSHHGGSQELPILQDMTPRFSLISDDASIDLLAELPAMNEQLEIKPVLARVVDFDGMALVTMEHSIIYTEFSNEEFLDYLDHEGFDPDTFKQHMGDKPFQSEAYQRTLKTLVQIGKPNEPASEVHRRALEQDIEIVLLQNPYILDPGDELDVLVLFGGKPLPDHPVKAYNSNDNGSLTEQIQHTGSDGTARFALSGAGLWLFRLVHLIPCSGTSGADCEDADWESYWTAYSFELD